MTVQDQTEVITEYIRNQAPKYYPGLVAEQTSVQLIEKQTRSMAIIYRFKVSNKTHIHSVFAKVPLCNSPQNETHTSVYEKPLLYPKAANSDRQRLQFTALKAIEDYFADIDQTRFGAIRVLDYVPQYQALITEEASDPQLRRLLMKESRLRSPLRSGELTAAFQNAGTWLRLYRALPKNEDVKVRNEHRKEFVDSIARLIDFLARTLGDKSFFEELASVVIKKSYETLPESLPLGLGHGDYAPRNILIGPNARVTVLDTFAKWRTPIYEDIGYFLVELKLNSSQVISYGLAFSPNQLATYEHAFLKGYFGDEPIPYLAIRLYEILALLDKWSVTTAKFYQQPFFIQMVGQLGHISMNLYFKRRAKALLEKSLKTWNDNRALVTVAMIGTIQLITLNAWSIFDCMDYLC